MDRADWGNAVVQCNESSPQCKTCLLALSPHINDEGQVEAEIDEIYQNAGLNGMNRDDFRRFLRQSQSIGWLDNDGERLKISTPEQHDT